MKEGVGMQVKGHVIKESLKSVNWEIALMGILTLVLTWSSVPLEYASTIDTSSIRSDWGFMFIYEIGVALMAILMFNARFQSVWATVGILISVVAAGQSIRRVGLAIGLLMILFPIFFIILSFHQLGLQSGYGLAIYSLLATTCISLPFIKLSSGFLSWQAIAYIVPFFISFLFFVGPTFLKHSQWSRIIYSASGLLLILAIMLRGFTLSHFIAILVALLAWALMMAKKRPIDEFMTYTILQMICVLLMYWH